MHKDFNRRCRRKAATLTRTAKAEPVGYADERRYVNDKEDFTILDVKEVDVNYGGIQALKNINLIKQQFRNEDFNRR
ncbi:hypothetical protein H6G64_24545 [Calothrix sp. FACHB-156]|nr:hypothetical protein [Calothrix sp. FACHB-156]